MSDPSWRVDLAPAASRQLQKLPPGVTARARGPILALARDPRPAGSGPPVESPFWRVRVGDLRIVYLIADGRRTIVVVRVVRRNESTYRRVR